MLEHGYVIPHKSIRQDIIDDFDKSYNFIHIVNIPKLIIAGKMSYITGLCFDAALHRYAQIARLIEKTKQDYTSI